MSWRFCFLTLLALTLSGQDYRAKIQGVVTDSTDAAIASAQVTIRNINTGTAATRVTGVNGVYLFDNVEPGTYLVIAEFPGFSKQHQERELDPTQAPAPLKVVCHPRI